MTHLRERCTRGGGDSSRQSQSSRGHIHRPPRERSHVSCCIKYVVFGFNVVFWLLGALISAIGLWAWFEKNESNTFANLGRLTQITLDPALVFILAGSLMFILGFSGCIGALRENLCLLTFFCVVVGLLLVGELVLGILGFVYKDWFRDQIEVQFRKMIEHYRWDVDLQNLIDWIQNTWLSCCGANHYSDWELNRYFNCSAPGVEACGVPFSCCRPSNEELVNRYCGHGQRLDEADATRELVIYTEGCIKKGEMWLSDNLLPVAGLLVGIAVLQILAICFAYNLRNDIRAQIARWRIDDGYSFDVRQPLTPRYNNDRLPKHIGQIGPTCVMPQSHSTPNIPVYAESGLLPMRGVLAIDQTSYSLINPTLHPS